MSNRLPDTELCNLAFRSPAEKRQALVAFERPKLIKGTYAPWRKVLPDALNQQLPLFGTELHSTLLEKVKEALLRECKGSDEVFKMNLAVAAATFMYAEKHALKATKIDALPIKFTSCPPHNFGLDLLVRDHDGASLVFPDLRRKNGLSPQGRLVMYSAMHLRFREAYPDLAGARIQIWVYKDDTSRTLVSIAEPSQLFSYDDLAADFSETYQIWASVKNTEQSTLKAVGAPNPFGF